MFEVLHHRIIHLHAVSYKIRTKPIAIMNHFYPGNCAEKQNALKAELLVLVPRMILCTNDSCEPTIFNLKEMTPLSIPSFDRFLCLHE